MKFDPALSGTMRAKAQEAQAAGRLDEAEALYAAAVQLDPRSAQAHHDRGGFYRFIGRLDAAEAALSQAHHLAPDDPKTRHGLGIVLMSQGRYGEGWPLYDARHEIAELGLFKPQLPYPEWNRENPQGKRILIFPEQGLGDQIQFARFAPWLAAQGAEVTLLCHPALARLFEASFGVRVLAAVGEVDFPDPDYWVMSGSVAGRSGLWPEDLPNAPYLRWPAGDGVRTGGVGVVTRGNPAHANDVNRSLPPQFAAELMNLPGAVSLHPEDTGAGDFADTAALIAPLDLVISVDTSVAHLAAAMGKPTWILLPRLMNDWRWMETRTDSPWYPTARLFRQARPGDWASVLAQVQAAFGTHSAPAAGAGATVEAAPTGRTHWADPARPEADQRAQFAARMIPRGARVLDLGRRATALERFLPQGCAYLPCDLAAQDEGPQAGDFNAGEFPRDVACDMVVALGVLEYLFDAPAFLRRLRELGQPVVLSYCAAGRDGPADRRARGWVNDFTVDELAELAAQAGFAAAWEFIDSHQLIMRLQPAAAAAAAPGPEITAWVLSFNNIDNFGDRLGGHLLSQVLPPNACVRHIHHAPWDAPPEGEIDLLVLGMGNSMFGSVVTDELLALLDRARVSIGIFGTQYRSALPPEALAPVLDRLDAWFARSREDLLLYGKGRDNAHHLGDWLIQAFPLARPSLDETLEVTSGLADGPLDRAIETLQRYRRVVSPRLHPLLCALCSAEAVAYLEQRPDGRQASGKFRSLFLDIFGVDKPEGQFWPVDRPAVAAYKTLVDRNIAQARRIVAELLTKAERPEA